MVVLARKVFKGVHVHRVRVAPRGRHL
jgi:hypothetical protein